MNKIYIFIITVLILALFYFLYQKRQSRKEIEQAIAVLDDIIAGNDNRRIYVNNKTILTPLIFKINQVVDSYQDEKIELLKAEKGRKEMLSNLSHDLRTPLTSILGYLDALTGGIAGEEVDEYLDIAKNKAYALKDYIDELFVIAQIDADEIKLSLEEVDLFELLRSELIGWVPKLQQEDIFLEVDIPDGEYFIQGNEHALKRIFNNLVQNALNYGGVNNFIGVSAWVDNSNLYFEVWDKGPGLSKDEISKVFERLYKGDSSRSTKGHGLGLAISKDLVDQMKGSIWMESTPNVKTLVCVSLPKSKKK